MAEITYQQAIFHAQLEEMERDSRVILLGEGLLSDIHGTASGLAERFGPARVRGKTNCERGFVGLAGGLADRGGRPVVDSTTVPFLFPTMDQVCSFVAKSRFVYGGQVLLPLVIRSSLFCGAAQAERPYPEFIALPGITMIAPSNARDMKGLLKAAIRADEPVISFEDAACWPSACEVPLDFDFVLPLGKGEIRRSGSDVTIVAIAGAVDVALDAARTLQADGISAEVIDPRTLVPLDRAMILRSVRKTRRAICVEPGQEDASLLGEVIATISTDARDALCEPLVRMALPTAPMPPSQPSIGMTGAACRIAEAARVLVGVVVARSAAA